MPGARSLRRTGW